MGFFNFIETFFFISLAITFVLILLLVYHFKQRLSHLENKSETVVQIINNIVKEINNMRTYFTLPHQLANKSLNNISYSIQENNYGTYTTQYKEFDNEEQTDNLKAINDEDEEDDDEDEEEDEEEDDDEDDDEEDDEEEDDDEEDDEDDDDEDAKSNNLIHEINEVILEDENLTEEIKVINVGTSLEGENEIHAEDINSDDFIEPLEIDEQDEPVEIQEETDIHVEKINTIDLEKETLENETLENYSQISKESSKEIYQKMSVQALKALVISKGLCSDSNKMKKTELLKLLESSEDV